MPRVLMMNHLDVSLSPTSASFLSFPKGPAATDSTDLIPGSQSIRNLHPCPDRNTSFSRELCPFWISDGRGRFDCLGRFRDCRLTAAAIKTPSKDPRHECGAPGYPRYHSQTRFVQNLVGQENTMEICRPRCIDFAYGATPV